MTIKDTFEWDGVISGRLGEGVGNGRGYFVSHINLIAVLATVAICPVFASLAQ